MLGCGRQGTSRVLVQVGSLVVHDLPIPGLQVFNVVPIPVRVTREYSHTFTHTVIQNILESYNKKRRCWSVVASLSSSHSIGLEGGDWCHWHVVVVDGHRWT